MDEDLPRALVPLPTSFGHEAEHVVDLGLPGKPDRIVVAAARERGAVLFTADVAFGDTRLLPPGSHAGIVVLRFPNHFRREDILRLVERFLQSPDLPSIAGALVMLTPGAYRVRRR